VTAELVVPAPISLSAAAPAAGGDPLLQSKFAVPEPPSFLVARPRLTERLARGVREPVTLVVGPAGAGKTQLVASWAAAGTPGYPIGWITLEEEDGQSDAFWAYILEALRRAGVLIPGTLSAPQVPGPADRSFLVRLAAALAEQPEPVVLVLDGVANLPASTGPPTWSSCSGTPGGCCGWSWSAAGTRPCPCTATGWPAGWRRSAARTSPSPPTRPPSCSTCIRCR
jgi:hypothetical protein